MIELSHTELEIQEFITGAFEVPIELCFLYNAMTQWHPIFSSRVFPIFEAFTPEREIRSAAYKAYLIKQNLVFDSEIALCSWAACHHWPGLEKLHISMGVALPDVGLRVGLATRQSKRLDTESLYLLFGTLIAEVDNNRLRPVVIPDHQEAEAIRDELRSIGREVFFDRNLLFADQLTPSIIATLRVDNRRIRDCLDPLFDWLTFRSRCQRSEAFSDALDYEGKNQRCTSECQSTTPA